MIFFLVFLFVSGIYARVADYEDSIIKHKDVSVDDLTFQIPDNLLLDKILRRRQPHTFTESHSEYNSQYYLIRSMQQRNKRYTKSAGDGKSHHKKGHLKNHIHNFKERDEHDPSGRIPLLYYCHFKLCGMGPPSGRKRGRSRK